MTRKIPTRLRRYYRVMDGLSIQVKLILSYIIIILVPIVIFSWYFFNQMYSSTMREATRSSEYMLEIEKNNIINKMMVMESMAQIVASDRYVTDLLTTTNEPSAAELIQFNDTTQQNLLNLIFSNPTISSLRIFTSNPLVPEFWPIIFKEERVAAKPWIPKVLEQGETVWWEIGENEKEITKRYDPSIIATETYVMLLRGMQQYNKTIGILEMSVRLEDFFTSAFSNVQDPNSQMAIIDRNGQVYANKNSRFSKEVGIGEIKNQFAAHRDNNEDSFSFTYNGQPYLCIQTYIDKLDAHVLNIVSMKGSVSAITRWRNTIVAATLILIALLSVISYFLHSLILKKLTILRDSMKKVRKGDFQVDIPVSGTDEVGELAFHFRQMMKKINELIVEAVNRQASAKEAELKSLRNQIDSHFLYNTLENLKMMAEIEGQYTLSDALTSLGGMMRYNLRWTSNHVRLQEEVAHIQNYIAIMNIRYNDRLALQLEIPAPFLEQEVLKMSLQPLVENAVKHGMSSDAPISELLTITIQVYSHGDQMILVVQDDGSGITPERLRRLNLMLRMEDAEYQEMRNQLPAAEREGSGIGLRNVDQRIVMYYGKEYGIRAESKEGRYTRIFMTIPYLILTGGCSDAQITDRR
ncbi:cache domain-containing sensor histidine kinase [Gorillibacterium timonense]|uniref:cache domain-containing sensor histidine kinase n=1 Tax=Gorillibacterium timonense TaxID=1689269 RepID=UPI000AA5174B|nr:sensor histidine kinase [Gorillibacterium timonense]